MNKNIKNVKFWNLDFMKFWIFNWISDSCINLEYFIIIILNIIIYNKYTFITNKVLLFIIFYNWFYKL